MPNIQQPEMRRSGHDPLVQDHRQETATKGAPGGDPSPGPVPPEQVSPYGPGRERGPEAEAEAPGEEATDR